MKPSRLITLRFKPALALMLAGLAASVTPAVANQFGATALIPGNQTVNVGDSLSFDLIFSPGTSATNGLKTSITFDNTVLEMTSITTNTGLELTNVVNNTTGVSFYEVVGGFGFGSSYNLATILFNAIGPGTSVVDIYPEQYLIGYGYYGVNGLATDGFVTVEGSVPAVPDASSTFALLGGALMGFAALRRRLTRA